jgi:hypothetical protein
VIENQKQKAAANGDTVPEGLISYVYSLSVHTCIGATEMDGLSKQEEISCYMPMGK